VIVLLSILVLALIGAPLFVIIGAATAVAWHDYGSVAGLWSVGAKVLDPFEGLMTKDAFLAIPLFVGTGAVMTEGGMARRLVEVMRALLGWLPGGMGMAAVISCMGFAAISGSSPVTLIAVGSIMFPAMVKGRYPENFSLGLVMTAGSLGCLVAPSLILTIYALAVSTAGAGSVTTEQMWVAAYVPAGALALILCIYCFFVGLRSGERDEFSWPRVFAAVRDGVWALALPLIVFFGIKEGFFAPFKAGAVAFAYALAVTTLVHRELDFRKLFATLGEAARLMGLLILIIALTFSLNQLFAIVGLGDKLAEALTDWDLGPVGFMLLVNVVLIVIGALMDSVSATLVFAPILAPIAVTQYGIDPVHFGIVFVVNMEIGYLAPPVATNLFVASALFKKPFGQVSRAVLPGLTLTIAAMMLFIFVPTCSKGLPNYEATGDVREVWEPFPWDGKRVGTLLPREEGGGIGSITGDSAEEALKDTKIDTLTEDDYYFGGEGEDDPTAVEKAHADAGVAPAADAAAEEEEEDEDDEGGDDDLDGVQL
jgi:C4-dicarboxylate transporter DctM subunit